jgi:hypothetical protein
MVKFLRFFMLAAGLAVLSACLAEHPVLTDDLTIDIANLLKEKSGSIPAPNWEVRRIENGDTSLIFAGKTEEFATIPKIVVVNGVDPEIHIRGLDPFFRTCYEADLRRNWEGNMVRNCEGILPGGWLTTNGPDFKVGDTLRWSIRVPLSEIDEGICWVKGIFGRDTMYFLERMDTDLGIQDTTVILAEGKFSVSWQIVHPSGLKALDARYFTVVADSTN